MQEPQQVIIRYRADLTLFGAIVVYEDGVAIVDANSNQVRLQGCLLAIEALLYRNQCHYNWP